MYSYLQIYHSLVSFSLVSSLSAFYVMEFEAVKDAIEIKEIDKDVRNKWNADWLRQEIDVKELKGDGNYKCQVGEYIEKGEELSYDSAIDCIRLFLPAKKSYILDYVIAFAKLRLLLLSKTHYFNTDCGTII